MPNQRLTAGELDLAKVIWEHAPLRTKDLVVLCLERFNWQRTTTYTMLKRLENLGVVRNESRVIQVLVTREQYDEQQSISFVQDTFGGSLPGFVAAFMRRKKLSEKDIHQLKSLIDGYKGGEL